MESLGKNIRKIRKKWGFDQDAFGAFMGVSKQMISLYETGTNDPKLPFFVRLCELTNIDAKTMYDGEVLAAQIPLQPLKPGEGKIFQEPTIKYDQTTHDLLSFPALVATVQELIKRVEVLEKKIQ